MAFDWMHATLPEHLHARHVAAREAMHRDEIRARAALLRRLGYPADYAVHRCLGNLDWGFELRGEPPVDREAVHALVEAVYSR